MGRLWRIILTWASNTANSLVFLLSGGRWVLHEGIYLFGWWLNWSRTFRCRPRYYFAPETEEDLCRLVRDAEKVRVVGAGHSFNASPLTGHTLISLDDYNRVLGVDREKQRVRVQAGIRLRDLNRELKTHGLSLPVAGSTDAQSIAGLLATDLHGTGRDHGFLSEQIRSLKLVDGRGQLRRFQPDNDAFHAAMGSIGTCGIVCEVELQCVKAFNLVKSTRLMPRAEAEAQIDELLKQHDHLSFYYLGGLPFETVRANVWDRTDRPPGRFRQVKKIFWELVDMLASGYLLGIFRLFAPFVFTHDFGFTACNISLGQSAEVYPSADGFSRKLYFRHDELEYGIPFERYQRCLEEVLEHLKKRSFVTIVEIRFTPDTSQGLLGPGAGRRTCYIELAPSLSLDTDPVFREVEKILLAHAGQVHLGKKTWIDAARLRRMYASDNRFDRVVATRHELDPDNKFLNEFTEKLFTSQAPRREPKAQSSKFEEIQSPKGQIPN